MFATFIKASELGEGMWIEARVSENSPQWEWRKVKRVLSVGPTLIMVELNGDCGDTRVFPLKMNLICFDEYPNGVINRQDVPDWDEYFLGLAKSASVRAKCRRRKVGAILVGPDNHVLSTGYNGHPVSGSVRDCLSGGCPRGLMSTTAVNPYSSYDSGPGICIASHAEANAVAHRKERVEGCTMYVTDKPCFSCTKTIMANGVIRVVWLTDPHNSMDHDSCSVEDLFNQYLQEAVNSR